MVSQDHSETEGVLIRHKREVEITATATAPASRQPTPKPSNSSLAEDYSSQRRFFENLDSSSAPPSSVFSSPSEATTAVTSIMTNMGVHLPQNESAPSTASSSPASTISSATSSNADYSTVSSATGSSTASYTPSKIPHSPQRKYRLPMPDAFAYAPPPPPTTMTEETYSVARYPTRMHPATSQVEHDQPHTPPRTEPSTRTTSPLSYRHAPPMSRPPTQIPPNGNSFPRFSSLNVRLLRHLERELELLERGLEAVENRIDQVYRHGGYAVNTEQLEQERAEVMEKVAWKLGQYNQALINYQKMTDTFGPWDAPPSPSPSPPPIHRSHSYKSSHNSYVPGGWLQEPEASRNQSPQPHAASMRRNDTQATSTSPPSTVSAATAPKLNDDMILIGVRKRGRRRAKLRRDSDYGNGNDTISSSAVSSTISSTSSSVSSTSTSAPSTVKSHAVNTIRTQCDALCQHHQNFNATTAITKVNDPAADANAASLLGVLSPLFLTLGLVTSLDWAASWKQVVVVAVVLGLGGQGVKACKGAFEAGGGGSVEGEIGESGEGDGAVVRKGKKEWVSRVRREVVEEV
ncbi:hypothetical protein DFH27DRAFT_570577 [Peziza echinospora]|nr:hypothetical protein DFH27DRAFT_570577 [Peziza echinospora]